MTKSQALKSSAYANTSSVSGAVNHGQATPSQFDAEVATNIRTPRHNQAKNICSKVGEAAYGIFDESHQKSKATAHQELSHISPFSQKLFKFSGTGFSNGFSSALGHPSSHY